MVARRRKRHITSGLAAGGEHVNRLVAGGLRATAPRQNQPISPVVRPVSSCPSHDPSLPPKNQKTLRGQQSFLLDTKTSQLDLRTFPSGPLAQLVWRPSAWPESL